MNKVKFIKIVIVICAFIVGIMYNEVYAKSYTQYTAQDIIKHIIEDKKDIPNDSAVVEKWKSTLQAASYKNRDPNPANPSEYTKNLTEALQKVSSFQVNDSKDTSKEEDITQKYNDMTKEERMHMSVSDITEYVNKNNGFPDDKEVADAWKATLQNTQADELEDIAMSNGDKAVDIANAYKEAFYKTYHNPLFEVADDTSSSHTTDEIITEGDGFLNKGQQSTIPTISENAMNNVSDSIYTILLAVGIVVAVVWGIALGIKYMVSSIDDKAEIKKSLIPYLVGCFAMFASFGIWKLIILVVSQVNR